MGGHGHGHEPPYKIPDYRIYKVEDVPLLCKTRDALAAEGLKDPWLRNEVWRYDTKMWGTESGRLKLLFTRGLGVGIAATAVTLIATAIYDKVFPSSHDHGHGHGKH